MDPQLRRHLVQQITIEPWVGHAFDGTPTYGPGVVYAARIVGRNLQQRNTYVAQVGANEVAAPTFTIYIHGDNTTNITPRDRLTVPAQYGPDRATNATIFSVAAIPNDDGTYYFKLTAGWMYHRQGTL